MVENTTAAGTRWFGCALALVLATACGGKTGLNVDEFDREPDASDASVEEDVPIEEDVGVDTSVPDVPEDVPPDVTEDVFVPECPDSIRVTARESSIPVDIIWAIDTSGSMIDDTERMRENVRLFWDAISMADVDARVIFVGQRGNLPGAPAGFSGRYVEIDQRVGSTDALLQLLSTHRFYERYLRPDAITHFIVVSDDDSLGLDWEDFRISMLDLLGHDFTFHAVASERVMPSIGNPWGSCFHSGGTATRPGIEYYELADETGGLTLSICNEDWSELFPLLSERIAVRIPIRCAYSLPTPAPPGIIYDRESFNVLINTPGDPTPRLIDDVGTEEGCGEGWWYFEGSQRVELCPDTCEQVDALGGRVEVDLGCTFDR